MIANRLKPFLSKSISFEQMRFLQGKCIQDDIGTAHEILHSIKKKILKALLLKLVLRKFYDCIDWDHLRMILLKIGFGDSNEKLDNVMCHIIFLCSVN
jgi:hypothetical protein